MKRAPTTGSAGRRNSIPWRNSLQFHFSAGLAVILLSIIAATFAVVHFYAREFLLQKNEQLIHMTGQQMLNEITLKTNVAETLTKTLARLGETLPKDPRVYREVLSRAIDLDQYQDIIAGGGIWPEPGIFNADTDRSSFFWGRNAQGKLEYFDQYNDPDGSGYHHEEWYVQGKYSPRGHCLWSKSYTDPYSFEPMVTCTVPMHQGQQLLGAATVDLKLSGLRTILARTAETFEGYAFAVDRNNKLLSFPVEEYAKIYSSDDQGKRLEEFIDIQALARLFPTYQSTAEVLEQLNQSVITTAPAPLPRDLPERLALESYQITAGESPMIAAIISHHRDRQPAAALPVPAFFETDDLLLETPVMITVMLMPDTYWKIVMVTPFEQIAANADRVAKTVLFYLLAIVLVAGLISYALFQSRLIKPLFGLVNQLHQDRDENKVEHTLLDDNRHDELGLLAYQFNRRTLALEQNNRELALEINERRNAEKALRSSEKRMQSIAESAPDAIVTVNSQSKIIDWNPAATMIFQEDFSDKLGKSLFILLTADSIELLAPRIQRYLNGDDDALSSEVVSIRGHRHDGREFPLEIALASWQSDGQRFFTCFMRDISTRHKTEEQLRFLALHDPLTSLPNRALFQDRLKQAAALTKRNDHKFGLMFIDLDDFKTVNDTMGHDIGDELLVEVSQRILKIEREIDTVARLGGDEFAVILPRLTRSEDAATAAQRLIDCLQQPFTIDGNDIRIGASIGITIFPDDGERTEMMLRNADIAMYQAKADGRNTYCFFVDEMNSRLQNNKQILAELRKAIEQEHFELYFQPFVDLDTGALSGAEALIRWNHPKLGQISPAKFIPIAENSGLIINIGDWVLAAACQAIKLMDKADLPPFKVAINVSPVQFRRPSLVQTMLDIIRQHRGNPTRIECEITEGAVMHDVDGAIRTMHAMDDAGIMMSIDDFGTGYSSLSYLKRFPISKIKIDRSFIADLQWDADSKSITRAVIQMGHSLNVEVLAEGVENESQMGILRQEGCDYVQGYHTGVPMPVDEFIRWYHKHYPSTNAAD